MPVVERVAPGRVRICFRWEGEAQEVRVRGAVEALGDTALRRGEDGVWTLELEAPSDLRTVYWLALDGADDWTAWLPDPDCATPYRYPAGLEFTGDRDVVGSLLELPDAPPLRWSLERDVPHGTVVEHVLDGRRVWLYEPPRPPEGLLLLFDGHAYTTLAPAPVVLDNLLAEGLIPPTAAVLPDSLDTETRLRELGGDEAFRTWACDRLLPWAGVNAPRERTVVAGSSMGGVAAVRFAIERPDLFGGVLALSPAILRPLPVPGGLGVRWYVDGGVLEELHAPAQVFAEALRAEGYEVTWRDFPGGHDFFWWRETLADGLLAVLG